jgi:Holliday junction DNA helicase RuvA
LITSLQGLVQQIEEEGIVLDVGGVGLAVSVPADVLELAPPVGGSLFLHTQLIVRDEQPHLYGFHTPEQREIFSMLLQISGIGPKLALAILSTLSPDLLRSAVSNNEADLLATVPGIGKKTAEKMIFHLKDRIAVPDELEAVPLGIDNEVIDVLTALGYSLLEAKTAVRSIPPETEEDVEKRVRIALRYFSEG